MPLFVQEVFDLKANALLQLALAQIVNLRDCKLQFRGQVLRSMLTMGLAIP